MVSKCTSRTKSQECWKLRHRLECLTSTESRARFDGTDCVWCPNGPCTSKNDNQCEPQGWLVDKGVTDFETCAKQGIKPY